MKKQGIAYFALKALAVGAVPLLVLVAAYAWLDPLKVLRSYDYYFESPSVRDRYGVNKGMVSVRTIDALMDSMHYDSYIFGASISIYYPARYWAKYLPEGASPVHFDSSQEGLRSMRHKIEYLARRGYPVRNALIVLDARLMAMEMESDQFLYIDPPEIMPPLHWLKWHYKMFGTFIDRDYLLNYMVNRITGRRIYVSDKSIFEPQPIVYLRDVNEETIPEWDDSIVNHPDEFFPPDYFPAHADRRFHCSDTARIDAERETEMRRIAGLLRELDADYRVVVGPNMLKDTLSMRDRRLMQDIFGRDRVFDFSSSEAHVVDCDTNFYDFIHYRPPVARRFIDNIYNSVQCSSTR